MRKSFYFVLFLSLCLSGCATLRTETDTIHGMIVTDSNGPLADADIFVKQKIIGRTNANGFFEINVSPKSDLKFTVSKPGWERKEIHETFVDKTHLYVYQISSLEPVYSEIEKALAENDLCSAENLADDLENKHGDKENALFLKCIISYKRGDFENARKYFYESKSVSDKNPAVKKFYEKIGEELCKISK